MILIKILMNRGSCQRRPDWMISKTRAIKERINKPFQNVFIQAGMVKVVLTNLDFCHKSSFAIVFLTKFIIVVIS